MVEWVSGFQKAVQFSVLLDICVKAYKVKGTGLFCHSNTGRMCPVFELLRMLRRLQMLRMLQIFLRNLRFLRMLRMSLRLQMVQMLRMLQLFLRNLRMVELTSGFRRAVQFSVLIDICVKAYKVKGTGLFCHSNTGRMCPVFELLRMLRRLQMLRMLQIFLRNLRFLRMLRMSLRLQMVQMLRMLQLFLRNLRMVELTSGFRRAVQFSVLIDICVKAYKVKVTGLFCLFCCSNTGRVCPVFELLLGWTVLEFCVGVLLFCFFEIKFSLSIKFFVIKFSFPTSTTDDHHINLNLGIRN